jgi:hypothetical protein
LPQLAALSGLVYLVDWMVGTILTSIQAVPLVLSLLIFRQCGYRLVRQPRRAVPEPAIASVE